VVEVEDFVVVGEVIVVVDVIVVEDVDVDVDHMMKDHQLKFVVYFLFLFYIDSYSRDWCLHA
jgi:hypothetical protein